MTTTMTCTYIGPHGHKSTCTHPVVPGRSYCEHHLFVVYQQGSNRQRRRKDERTAAAVWSVQDSFNEAVAELEAEGYDFGEERWQVRELDLD